MISKKTVSLLLISCIVISERTSAFSESFLAKIPLKIPKKGIELVIPFDEDSQQKIVHMISYDEEIYNLAYETYLQSNNLSFAYIVSFSAVQQQPNNEKWRERLAEISNWNNEPAVSLKQYEILSEVFHNQTATKKGILLAKKMHEDPALIRFILQEFLNKHYTLEYWDDYVNAMLRLGNIETLKNKIISSKDVIPSVFYYQTLSRIYKLCDEPLEQLSILKETINHFGIEPETALEIATIYSGEGRILEAFDVLRKAITAHGIKTFKFWQSYALLASLLNKNQLESYANQEMLQFKDADSSVFSRQIELFSVIEPQKAWEFALRGKKRFPKAYYLLTQVLSLLIEQKRGYAFPMVMKGLSNTMILKLKHNENYWRARVLYFESLGNDGEILDTWRQALEVMPDNIALKTDFLYYLLGSNQTALAKKYAVLWDNVNNTDAFQSAITQIYARDGDRRSVHHAIAPLYEKFESHADDPYWLTFFKDTLENAYFEKDAKKVNHLAWPLYLHYLKRQTDDYSQTELIDYVKLSMLEASGDPTAIAFYQLQDHETEDTELLLLTWSLSKHFSSLSKAIYWHYNAKGIRPPNWAALSIALTRHDKRTIRNILINKKETASYRDEVAAAIEIKALPLGQTRAFKALEKHRKDEQLYDNYFTPVMLKTARHFDAAQDYYQYGSLIGPRSNLSYTWFLMPSLSLTPYETIWLTHNMPGGNFANNGLPFAGNQPIARVPPIDERAGVRFHVIQNRGDLQLDLGYRKNLTSFMTAKLTKDFIALSDLNFSFSLGFNQPSDDTASMLIGGMKDMAELVLRYRVLAGETLTFIYDQNQFYTQDRQYLTHGYQAYAAFEHKLWGSYPDFSLRPYGYITQYYDRTRAPLRGTVLELVPEGVVADVNFLIPISFNEYGLTVSYGEKYIEEYTHRFRPFSSFTISRNSAVGLGEIFNLGIAGALFGRDHLLIYYEWGNNQAQGIQTSQLIRLSYRMYS